MRKAATTSMRNRFENLPCFQRGSETNELAAGWQQLQRSRQGADQAHRARRSCSRPRSCSCNPSIRWICTPVNGSAPFPRPVPPADQSVCHECRSVLDPEEPEAGGAAMTLLKPKPKLPARTSVRMQGLLLHARSTTRP